MKAFLFSAGLGTRLRPYTNDRPKALVEVGGIPLVEIALGKLRDAGVTDVMVNVHHFADMLEAFLKSKDFGLNVHFSDEREHLLDTGGGLLKAASFFDDGKPFFAVNVDIMTGLKFKNVYQKHLALGGLATLAVQKRPSSRNLLFEGHNMRLCGWQNTKTGETKQPRQINGKAVVYSFSGIQVIDPKLLELLQRDETLSKLFPKNTPFSIISVYLALANDFLILGHDHSKDFWTDLGTPEALMAMEDKLTWG